MSQPNELSLKDLLIKKWPASADVLQTMHIGIVTVDCPCGGGLTSVVYPNVPSSYNDFVYQITKFDINYVEWVNDWVFCPKCGAEVRRSKDA